LTLKHYRARIRISTKSRRAATSIRDALAPDLNSLPKTEGLGQISLENSYVIFEIETTHIASLRANVNSFLRLVDTSYKCITV
jgi:tRNA threonylcarbamoyladenosine modification (KEOPS) complex  Pcc1 subunit